MFRTVRLALCLAIPAALFAAEAPGVWLDVPFVKQSKNACGAASIAMIMQYWQRQQGQPAAADAEAIQRAVYSPDAGGAYARDIEDYLSRHGFRTFAFRGDWSVLKDHLQKGRPLIVALKSGGDLHYVVLTGLDWDRQVAIKNDPAERKLLQQARGSFEKEWHEANNWTLLAVPESSASSQ
jgi:ABC-type bacteriocin/lantibiotic exporter with double-glycine peptidase domain